MNIHYRVILTVVLLTSPAHVLADKYLYGDIDRRGNIDMYDDRGNYYYGDVDRRGNVELYDNKGNYYYGDVD